MYKKLKIVLKNHHIFLPPQARNDDGILIYEAFPHHHSKMDNHLKIRFKKVQHNLILKVI